MRRREFITLLGGSKIWSGCGLQEATIFVAGCLAEMLLEQVLNLRRVVFDAISKL